MSAPALSWSTLPEYQPPLRLVPPDPDEFDLEDPTVRWHTPRAVPGPGYRLPDPPPPRDCPVWDEPGAVRDQMWRLLSLILEVFDGRRTITQLRGVISPPVFEALATRSQHTAGAGRQHRLRTLHTCRPARGVLEICGTVAITAPGARPHAITLAARVEQHQGHWLCTALRPLYPSTRR